MMIFSIKADTIDRFSLTLFMPIFFIATRSDRSAASFAAVYRPSGNQP
jgi:hypothetical protein